MSLAPGTRLGAYEITAPLGAGGMGEVYRARDTRLNRDVAIKVLPEAFATDSERLARFKREAQVLASLNHPHIAAIYGLEETATASALVLELVEGPTLADRIAQGPIPVDQALPIAKQICEALEAAHERGIIHRDLKPANIKLTPDGTVKVLDFGLAKPTGGSGSATTSLSPTITSPAMTMAGVLLGSAAYMSPEQAKGREADKRSDVWGFGCVLYEMLTGKRAFDGEDLTETIAAVVKSEPDWNALAANIPSQVRLLLRRCLEKDRGKRITDLGTARFILVEPLATGVERQHATTMPPSVWKRFGPAVVSAVFAGTAVAGAMWVLRPIAPQTVTRLSYQLGENQRFTKTGRLLDAISPDGTQMVYVANSRLYLKQSLEFRASPLQGTEGASVTTPVFSPDGNEIVFYSGQGLTGGVGSLKKIATAGGTAITLCEATNPHGMSWSGDQILFGQTDKGILQVSANGGTPEVLVSVKEGELAYGPQLLPDGRALLYTLTQGTDLENAQVVAQTLGSSDRKTVISRGADARYLPTGHIAYAVSGVLFISRFDARQLAVVGGAVTAVEGVRRGNATLAANYAVSDTGTLIYIRGPVSSGGVSDLALVDRKGVAEPLKLPGHAYVGPRFSPDGRYLAVGTESGKEAFISIYDLSGKSSIRRLTFGGNNRYPIWTADSSRVAFQSDSGGDLAIFWQRADGTEPAERLTKPDKGIAHIPQAWSPRDDIFLYSAGSGSNHSLWTFSVRDKKTEPFGDVRSLVAVSSSFSPNGTWVAYQSGENGPLRLYVQPYPASGTRFEIANGLHPVWTGNEVVFSGAQAGQFSVVGVNTQPSFTVATSTSSIPRPGYVPNADFRNFDIVRGGDRFVIVVGREDPATQGEGPQIEIVQNWFEEVKRLAPVH